MSNLSQFLGSSSGGGGGAPVNTIVELSVGGVTQYTDASGGEWLKTGNVLTTGLTNYPDAVVKTRPSISSFSSDAVTGTLNGYSNLTRMRFKPDGTRVYAIDSSINYIFQWNLSTAWDLSTISASSTGNYNLGNFGTPTSGFDITKDGKFLYVTIGGSNKKSIGVIQLSTAWDLSTADNNNRSSSGTDMDYTWQYFSSSTTPYGMSEPEDICLSKDDSRIYVKYLNMLIQFKTPNAAGWLGNSNFIIESSTQLNGVYQLGFDPNRERIYIQQNNGRLRECDINPNDISTIKYIGNYSTTLFDTLGNWPQIEFKSDSTKLYALAYNTNTIHQFSVTPEEYIGVPYTVTSNSYLKIK